MYCLTNFLFFDILLLYYYHINLKSSKIFCLSSGDIYFSFGIFLPYLFITVSELICWEFFETFVILSAILLPIKSPVASSVCGIALFELVWSASVADCDYIYCLSF